MEPGKEAQDLGQIFDLIEITLLELEERPDDASLVEDLFNALKQMQATVEECGLSDFSQPIHTLDLSLGWVRDGRLPVNQELIDFLMMSIDSLRRLLVLLKGDCLKQETASQPPSPPPDSSVPPAPKAEAKTRPEGGTGPARPEKTMIRVDADRFASLSEVVQELMVQHTIITENGFGGDQESRRLRGNLNVLGGVIDNLQDRLVELRMVPLRTTFSRMGRLVREVAQKTGKRVDLKMEGEETELDRQVIDEINDPLVHLLRNAVDHGIEMPSERQAAGKQVRGTIHLLAHRQGDRILICIQDDGQGLNREAIYRKGLEKGLIKEQREYSDQEIFDLILHPGFSTAKAVSDISGRGVGMDVVAESIRRLKAELKIDSQLGQGTTFTISIPLDLTISEGIVDGVVVRIGLEKYVVPVGSMVEAVYPKKKEVNTIANGDEVLWLRGKNYPLVRLYRLFEIEPETENPWEAMVVIVEEETKALALMVDGIIRQQKAVVRALNRLIFRCPAVSGYALMGDEAGLVIDIDGLAESLAGPALPA